MFKALLKKQFLELNKHYFYNIKTNKRRSTPGIAGMILLFTLVFISIGASFFGMGSLFCDAFAGTPIQWFYFALMGLIAIAVGVLGSTLSTFTSLYRSKDNELLLAMPIPPLVILASRMIGVYAMSLLFTGIVWVPASVCFFVFGAPSGISIVTSILLWFALAAFVTVLSSLLGWVVALFASKLKNHTFAVVAISLTLMALYYFIYFRLNKIMQTIVANGELYAGTIRSRILPLYWLGVAGSGDVKTFILVFIAAFALLALACLIMSRNFIKILTHSSGGQKKAYESRLMKSRSVSKALLWREFKRFTASAAYMLNMGLGLMIMLIGSIVIAVKACAVRDAFSMFEGYYAPIRTSLPWLVLSAICLVASMNCISAPSVSIEGKSIWITQTLPVDPKAVIAAKLKLHLLLNLLPTVALWLSVCISLRFPLGVSAALLFLLFMFIYLTDVVGLTLNLHMPNLSWTNEQAAVKSGANVALTLFGGWAFALVIGAGALFIRFMPAWLFVAVLFALVAGAEALLTRHLLTKGADIYARL